MQSISANLSAALLTIDARVNPRRPLDLYEFYSSDAVPGVDGFDPADAMETFSSVEITWNGIAYRREVKSRSDIVRSMGEKTNSCTITFSNISRYCATWAQTQQIEGLICVIRTIVPSVTDDSITIFVSKCEKPGDIDKKEFTLSVRQDFGNINQTLPPRKFLAEDPEGRLPGDPLYEGISFTAVVGSNAFNTREPSTSFFGRLFGRQRDVPVTEQWSSTDETPYGQVMPETFGRAQLQLIPFSWADKGSHVGYLMAAGNGPIAAIENIKSKTEGLSDPVCNFNLDPPGIHLGDLGGTGTNTGNTCQADLAGGQVFSHLAYIDGASIGSEVSVVDDVPVIVALIVGRIIPVPNSSGVYSLESWTDNPVHIARFILTNPAFVNIDPGFMEDSVNYQTALRCDAPLIDDSNDQLIAVNSTDFPVAGTAFTRYRSTGILNSLWFRFNHLGGLIAPYLQDGPYNSWEPTDPVLPELPDGTFIKQVLLVKRATCNFPITAEVRAVDLLYKTVLPTFKGYIRVNKRGKYELQDERPSDATFLRAATAVGAVAVLILDVTPWKTGPDLLQGRLLVGNTLTTSEVRDVSSADYSTSGNSITLTASTTGTITATASGVTLTGGSTTVQASGTVTLNWTTVAGDTVTVTIDGIAVTYVVDSVDTQSTAAMLSALINATPKLQKYIKAYWSGNIVTIKCLHGALNLSSALLKAHGGPVVNPLVAPTAAASAGGSLDAGTYQLAYANVNSLGSTALTPVSSVVVTANQKIDVSGLPAFPAGITSRVFYLSERVNSTNLRYSVTRADAANFSITDDPLPGAALPPAYNTTAEELIRVAMSFATNSQDVYPAWRPGITPDDLAVYLPTVPNGHKYQATAEGPTGTVEPTWPTGSGATVADNDNVLWTEIGSTVLAQAGLTRSNVVKDSFSWPLGSRQSSVNQIKGKFRDFKNDAALTPFTVNDRDHQDRVKKIYPLEVDLSAVDNWHQANRLGNGLLSKHREGDWFNSLGTGPQGLVLEEGDVICASDDSGGLINVVTRIEELRIKANHDVVIVQARKYSSLMFADEVGAHNIPIPSTLRFTKIADSIVEFIDSFPIRDEDALTPGFYVSVSRDLDDKGDWRGWALWADYGDGYVKIAKGDIPAMIGVGTTTLATVADPSVFDRANSFTFTLDYGPDTAAFTSVTEQELLASSRRNLFIIGDEYVQAATIVDNGNRSYTISTLLRGRFGTNGTELTHGASERVVFLDGSEQFVAIDPVRLNGEFNYKVVTTNQDVADATAVPFTWTGGTVKPLSPVNLQGYRGGKLSADLLIEWTRRSRIGPGLRSYSDVPLGEEVERYLVEVYSGSTLKRSWIVDAETSNPIVWRDTYPADPGFGVDTNGELFHSEFEPGGRAVSLQKFSDNVLVEFTRSAVAFFYDELPVTFAVIPHSSDDAASAQALYYWVGGAPASGGATAGFAYPEKQPGLERGGTLGDRFGIKMRGGVPQYYFNSQLLYTSLRTSTASLFHVVVDFISGTNGAVRSARIQGIPTNAVYSYEMQVEDFGAAQSGIKIRVYEVSAMVGRGGYVETYL